MSGTKKYLGITNNQTADNLALGYHYNLLLHHSLFSPDPEIPIVFHLILEDNQAPSPFRAFVLWSFCWAPSPGWSLMGGSLSSSQPKSSIIRRASSLLISHPLFSQYLVHILCGRHHAQKLIDFICLFTYCLFSFLQEVWDHIGISSTKDRKTLAMD